MGMPIGGAAMRAGNYCNNSEMKNRVARTGNRVFRFSHFINVQIRFFEESAFVSCEVLQLCNCRSSENMRGRSSFLHAAGHCFSALRNSNCTVEQRQS
jgi:hypothetical protein